MEARRVEEGMSSGHGGPSLIDETLVLLAVGSLICWGAVDMMISLA